MTDSRDAGGKTGYYIRLASLLGILALLGGTLYFDRMVKIPANKERMDKLCDFLEKNFDGLEKSKVRAEAGMTPASTTSVGKFEVDHFRYSRALPFLPSGQNLYVVYDGDYYSHYSTDAKSVTEEGLANSDRLTAPRIGLDPNRPAPPSSGSLVAAGASAAGEEPPASGAQEPADKEPSTEEGGSDSDKQQNADNTDGENAAGESGADSGGENAGSPTDDDQGSQPPTTGGGDG